MIPARTINDFLSQSRHHFGLLHPPSQDSSRIKRGLLALSLLTAFSGGYLLHEQVRFPGAHAAAVQATAATLPVAGPGPATALTDFSSIVAAQGPAVVNISVSGMTKARLPDLPGTGATPFDELFRSFGFPVPRGHGEGMPTHGQGSGFIVSRDGIVLTNAHVVDDADEVMVKLTDKREFKAKVIGIDKQTDVAVLRIDAHDLPTVKVGRTDEVRVGEWVLAIGSPFGFENSVTAGIVSAKSRALPDEGYVPFIQTDVAINPGNSGGPLLNKRGEVIGINSQIYSRSGGYQGLSFAIPIDVAMNVEQQLLAHGKVSRGRLGISVQEVDQALADSFGLDRPRGALVASLDDDGPAAKAGLMEGDIILGYNGKPVTRSNELPPLVAATAPGNRIDLDIWRKGAPRHLALTVGELTDSSATAAAGSAGEGSRLGLALRPLAPEEKRLIDGGSGLVVEDVADGPAARSGIRPGDILIAANGVKLGSVEQLRQLVGKEGKRLALLVQRGERRLFVPIALG